ncbi:MAG TPA: glutamate formimidoyltransferase [Bacteroidales bacterium]|nr:glutamate formimidoyltransferase [Bacteroidales bacterium]HQK37533.1 glutamate formimidoyltransferase [Bacteroidales bacterium]
MQKIIECVPNFSEGRDRRVIDEIASAISSVDGAYLLNVDPGKATNRTVITFAGAPEPVLEAAFRAVKKAMELIDMTKHHGEHPRFGATDVLPLVPVQGITMEETAELARALGKRIGEELGIPVYLYEYAATRTERKNLAAVRAGEYEGLRAKLADPAWKPDYGPATFLPRTGAIAVGARDFLIAYNINLNTTSTRRANAVAFDIREKGRPKREGNPVTGKIVRDEQGNPVMIPGSLRHVKAIGWFIEEYGIAQVSCNLTNIRETPLHVVFEEACRKAEARGMRVTGSEIVGLVPLHSLLEAGKYFLKKQKRSTGVSDEELIRIAVRSLGLNDLYPFRPEEKVIEYLLREKGISLLSDLTVRGFLEETASESPAPGGGSVSALMAAAGASLGMMVANLSAHKPGWDERWEEFSQWAEKAKTIQQELIRLIDEDTRAFNALMEAYRLPKSTEEESSRRTSAIQEAVLHAMEVPLQVMKFALQALPVVKAMAETGNPNSVSDAAVGALALAAGIRGARLNVEINASSLKDKEKAAQFLREADEIEQQAAGYEKTILDFVRSTLKH